MSASPALVAAGLAATSVWLALPPRRMPGRRRSLEHLVPTWLQPRADAVSQQWRTAAGLAVGLAVLSVVPGIVALPLAALAGLVTAVALGRVAPRGAAQRQRQTVLQLPETLDLLAACLEAGAPLRQAVAEVAAVAPPATAHTLELVSAQVRVGMGDDEAWETLADDPLWGEVARGLARSAWTGTASAQVLRKYAEDARARRRDELLKQARAVGVRSVMPLMACFLPAFLLVGVVPVVAGLVGPLLHR